MLSQKASSIVGTARVQCFQNKRAPAGTTFGICNVLLAFGSAAENPEGRTNQILTDTERKSGNLIIMGGPAVNPEEKYVIGAGFPI